MDDAPLVSIVLPVWNGERYLKEAIESVLEQSYGKFEFIIVNDCSTDSTLQIAQAYEQKDARITVVNNKENLKLPASLNKGFSNARGLYFTWTSDDNVLEPRFLETLLKELLNSEVDIVYSDFKSIDEHGAFLNVSEVGDAEGLVGTNTVGAAFLYTRKVHQVLNGYDTGKFLYEDYDFWVRAYLAGFCFKRVQYLVYNYRRHAGALTSSRRMPEEYPLYRFNLRHKFSNVSRNSAYQAREILLGYRRELGATKTLLLLFEAFRLKPLRASAYVWQRLKNACGKLFAFRFIVKTRS